MNACPFMYFPTCPDRLAASDKSSKCELHAYPLATTNVFARYSTSLPSCVTARAAITFFFAPSRIRSRTGRANIAGSAALAGRAPVIGDRIFGLRRSLKGNPALFAPFLQPRQTPGQRHRLHGIGLAALILGKRARLA